MSTTTTSKNADFSQEDGHQLAADMLREIRKHYAARELQAGLAGKSLAEEAQLSELWRTDESVVLRRYMAIVTNHPDTALAQGFFAVLTDFIGCAHESATDPEFYERNVS